jgi:O-acetylserine/cysteine efflux transporter
MVQIFELLPVRPLVGLLHNVSMSKPIAFSARDSAFALFIVVSWGMNFVVMKFGLASFTPFEMGAARYLMASLPLALLIRPTRLPTRWVILYGFTQGVGQFGLLFTALKLGMTASMASVLMQTQVFFTALISMLILGERLTRAQWLGLGLAALGLGCFAAHFAAKQGSAASTITVLSFAVTLCAAASWALSNIVARKAQQAAPGCDPLAFVVWSALVPVVPFVLLSAWWDTGDVWQSIAAMLNAPWTAWAAAAYLGWVATVMAYAMWTALLKRHTANRVAPLGLGVPVVGIAAGMLILGEPVSSWQWAGVACVAAALAAALFGNKIFDKNG